MRAFASLLAATAVVAQTPPAGITRTAGVENATVIIAHIRMEPGAREPMHTHPFSAVVVQLTPGTIDQTIGKVRAHHGREPGFVWFIPKETMHAAINTGANAVEFATIGLKPDRPAAPAAPPTAAPPGITREPILDNEEVRVVRVTFTPGSREPLHTHPNDLATVQITAGRVEIVDGTTRSDEERPVGFVKFLARGTPHSYASTDATPFQLLSVSIK